MFFVDEEINTVSTFDPIRFINLNSDVLDPLDSFMIINIRKLPVYGNYIIQTETCRPDLISYNIYQTTDYWWLLLIYNQILTINELQPGKEIKYPSLLSINYLYEQAYLCKKVS